jgi:hypothetical protein
MPNIFKNNLLSILLITTLAAIIYSNTFDASFHFDDQHSIIEYDVVHQFDLKKILTSPRPILDITFAINYYFGKLDVFGYHLVNLLLHIANGIMLYFILLWTINIIHAANGADFSSLIKVKAPLYASLIFIAHPVQTQAVTYIVSRSSVLATFFYLLSLLLFIRACIAESKYRSHKSRVFVIRLYFSGAFLFSCLGMGTKQIVATLPLMLLIYDFYFICDGNWRLLKGHYKIHLIMFLTIFITVYLSFSVLDMFVSFDYGKGAEGVAMPLMLKEPPVTSFQYFLTQLHVIPYYIKLLILPTHLNLDYDWPITRGVDLPAVLFFIMLSVIIVIAIAFFKRVRLISFGIIWFFVTLSVTSSFIVIHDVIFEHRLYLPSVGFAVIVAVVISKISNLKKKFRAD